MNMPRTLLPVVSFFITISLFTIAAVAQTESKPGSEPSYDVSVQLLIGSNESGTRGPATSAMSSVINQLRSNFPFSTFTSGGVFVGRVANLGSFEYKSVSNIFGSESDVKAQSFLEWSVVSLRSAGAPGERGTVQAQSFRFGARIPIVVSTFKDDAGKERPTVSYENIGISLGRVTVAENVPTLIGSLNLPGTSGTIFLVMTVKNTDR